MVGWCTAFEAPAQGNHHDVHTEEEEEEDEMEEEEEEKEEDIMNLKYLPM